MYYTYVCGCSSEYSIEPVSLAVINTHSKSEFSAVGVCLPQDGKQLQKCDLKKNTNTIKYCLYRMESAKCRQIFPDPVASSLLIGRISHLSLVVVDGQVLPATFHRGQSAHGHTADSVGEEQLSQLLTLLPLKRETNIFKCPLLRAQGGSLGRIKERR